MSFQRVGVRFAAEAAAILAAAVIAGPVLHLVWWEVGAAVFAVLGLGVLVESSLAERTEPRPAAPEPVQAPPVVEEAQPTHVRVIQERPLAAPVPAPVPEPVLEPQPEPEPVPEPVAVATAPASAPARVAGPPYNFAELERALAGSGTANDEQTFLLQYLRDYAGADGNLPSEFDDLVRESFGALL
ncbi:MAG TPA: hypothetical protein VGU02_05150 [Gaiellaceae bacterium]|nr:hypothetical protein [Gaiellaceae bacterium]